MVLNKKYRGLFLKIQKFILISGIGWLIDFSGFLILILIFKIPFFYSNILSVIPAITFVFIFSIKKVFKNKYSSKVPLFYKYLFYVLYQIFLILGISFLGESIFYFIQGILEDNHLKIFIKILLTGITIICNYFFMYFLLEKN